MALLLGFLCGSAKIFGGTFTRLRKPLTAADVVAFFAEGVHKTA